MMKNVEFNKIVIDRLSSLDMTRSKLAEKLGVSNGQITHYLKGDNEIPFQNIVKICDILNLNLNQIFGIYDASISKEEMQIIEKYRMLNDDSKNECELIIDYILHRQRNKRKG